MKPILPTNTPYQPSQDVLSKYPTDNKDLLAYLQKETSRQTRIQTVDRLITSIFK